MMGSWMGTTLGPNFSLTTAMTFSKEAFSRSIWLMTTMRAVKRRLNPRLSIFGVLLTMFDGRTNFSNQVAQEVRKHFPGKVYATAIPRNVRLAEAPSYGQPVTAYDRHSRGAEAYRAVAAEILGRV